MQKIFYKATENKLISGVCSGIAEYFSVNPWIVRLLFALCGICGLALYILLAVVLPEKAADGEAVAAAKLYKTNKNKLITGVCSGVGEILGLNPWLVRLAFAICGIGGLAVYIALTIVLPEKAA